METNDEMKVKSQTVVRKGVSEEVGLRPPQNLTWEERVI